MEKLANRLAENIAKQMNYDQDKQEVIAYGLIALIQMLVIAVAVSIIGLIAGFWYEAIIIFLCVGLLRKSTGGAHAQTILGCTVISVVIISLMAALSRYILIDGLSVYLRLSIYIVIIGICASIAYRKVPVDTPNKPITRPEKIKRLRKQSFITIAFYAALCTMFLLLSVYQLRLSSISASIFCATVWQTFTLTRWGAVIIEALDAKFRSKY